jgi:cysteine synthase B
MRISNQLEMIEAAKRPKTLDRSVLDLVGNTPLLKMNRIGREFDGVEIYAKAEWSNPSGSVKDRAALSMIRDAESSGSLTHEKTIIDATSGNTGIALAMFGAALGYRVHIYMPSNASDERKKMISAFGAQLTLTNPLEGTDGAQREVKKIIKENPERYFYSDQYNNAANWKAHYNGTAGEIIRQSNGAVTHFVAGLGTSGTFIGTTRKLKEYKPSIQCISVQPDSPLHGLEGLKHMQSAIVPGIYDPSLADDLLEISTEEAHAMMKRLSQEEGLLVGISSGANVAAALKVAKNITEGIVVTILCDDGSRYLSEGIWEGHG